MPFPSSRLRARGCLFGQIAGDSLGSLVEFQSAASIATQYPDGPRLLAAGGTFNLSAGQPTDDSEMALALARTCLSVGGYDAEAVGRAYVEWGYSQPFDMGGTTRQALAALRNRDNGQSTVSQANGALMRVSPLGIVFAGDPAGAADAAEADAKLTHPHPVTVGCNRSYAAALAVMVGGGGALPAWEEAVGQSPDGPVLDALIYANEGIPPEDYQRQMGWVLTAFQNAFFWLMRVENFEEALVATVRCGGDTDTNAAIVGALLGARDGVTEIPSQWVEAVENCQPGPGTRKPRPEVYWPNDAAELADALLALSPAGEA